MKVSFKILARYIRKLARDILIYFLTFLVCYLLVVFCNSKPWVTATSMDDKIKVFVICINFDEVVAAAEGSELQNTTKK